MACILSQSVHPGVGVGAAFGVSSSALFSPHGWIDIARPFSPKMDGSDDRWARPRMHRDSPAKIHPLQNGFILHRVIEVKDIMFDVHLSFN